MPLELSRVVCGATEAYWPLPMLGAPAVMSVGGTTEKLPLPPVVLRPVAAGRMVDVGGPATLNGLFVAKLPPPTKFDGKLPVL